MIFFTMQRTKLKMKKNEIHINIQIFKKTRIAAIKKKEINLYHQCYVYIEINIKTVIAT